MDDPDYQDMIGQHNLETYRQNSVGWDREESNERFALADKLARLQVEAKAREKKQREKE